MLNVIDWESPETHILLNPRMPCEEAQKIHHQLKAFNLSAHVWLATSGTTSRFKCVALSKEAFLISADAVNRHFQLTADDIWIHCLPDFHVGGLGIHARSYRSGAKIVKLSPWNCQKFYQMAMDHSATVSSLVPAQLYDIIQMNCRAPDSYRFTIIGGGVIAKEIFEQSWEMGWNAVPTYGMTECASQVAAAAIGDYDQYQPLEHVSVQLDDAENILIKSPSLLTGYAFPDAEAAAWEDPKNDGWFRTEDQGAIEKGLLQVFGRSSEIIKINGELVNLLQLQLKLETLQTKMKLRGTFAIVPVPHPRSGYTLHLAASEENKNQIISLQETYNEAVLPFEKISRIHQCATIPRTPLGKIIKLIF